MRMPNNHIQPMGAMFWIDRELEEQKVRADAARFIASELTFGQRYLPESKGGYKR